MKKNKILLIFSALTAVFVLAGVILLNDKPNNELADQTVEEETEQLDQAQVAGVETQESAPASEESDEASVENSEEAAEEGGTVEEEKAAEKTIQETHVLFYGETCPHCHDVLEWMEENQIQDKLSIVTKEVYNDSDNSEQLRLAALSCGMSSSGVPFLYTFQKDCLVGTPDIISFLAEQAGVEAE